MADNVTIPATGSGTATPVIATDDVGGVQYQRVKLDGGGDGATTPVLAGNGVAASAMRVTLASDSTGTVAATQSGSWATTVSGTVAVSAASLPLPTGASTAAKQPALGTAGTASADVITVQGVASMVALKVDGSGVTQPVSGTVTIQDGGGSITVDGTVAATQSGTWTVTGAGGTFPVTDSGGSLTIDAPVGTPAFVRLSDGAAAITTLPVSLASVPSHAVTNAGTFAVQAAGDVAHDAADSGAPIKVGAKAETSPKGITLVADADRTDLYADADGVLMVKLNTSGADFISERVSNTDGASTAFSNFTAVAGTKNAITTLSVFRTDAGTTLIYVDFRDGTAGAVLYSLPIPAGGGVVVSGAGMPLFKTSADKALAFDVSAATTTVYISASGYQTKV